MDISAYFERLLRLVRHGGGPVVIAGTLEEEPLVILTFSAYEGLVHQSSNVQESSPDAEQLDDEEFTPQPLGRQTAEALPPSELKPLGGLPVTRPRRPFGGMRNTTEQKMEIRQKPQDNSQNRRPIMRRPTPSTAGGEEQFYLESV